MSAAKQTLRTRLVMSGAFVGALVALSLSWTFSWGAAGGSSSAEQKTYSVTAHVSPGQCLTWGDDPAEAPAVVSCGKSHLFEVTDVLNLSAQFPPEATPPDVDKWREVADNRCGKNIEKYLGEPLDPNGRYSLTVLRPTTADWNNGLREVRCGLQRTAPNGEPLRSTGKAAKQDQSSVYEPGTCLGLAGKSVGAPTECSSEHSYEIIATLDLTREFAFTDGYPDPEEQNEWLDKQCNEKLASYTDDDGLDEGLMLGWDTVEKKSWQAGSTKVNCKVGKTLDDGSGLAATTGSVAADANGGSSPTSSTENG